PVDVSQFRLPNATSGTLRFNCNAPWKAEVLSSNIRDFALEAGEGEGGMKTELSYTMSPNDSGESLQAKVKFSLASDPAKSVTLTITHWTGFTVAVDFTPAIEESIPFPLQPADESVPAIPWVSTNSGGLNTQGETFFYKFTAPDGKEYLFGLKNGLISRYFASGLGFLRMNAGSIRLPAVEGYRLGYVEFTTAATNKTFSIARNPEGTDLIGAKKTTNTGDVAAWEFENTEYNTSYYEIVGSGSSRQRNLILLYVK
ncbi:MAG: BACON domain-containing protein, partial [Bacteroidales bacterium]|nr:BACON domain-containing protein [Bacteroidales bacterium]